MQHRPSYNPRFPTDSSQRRLRRQREIPKAAGREYVQAILLPYHLLPLTLSLSEHGAGATNAPGHTEEKRPGEAPVASDSGATNTGIDPAANNPGEKGIKGVPVDPKPDGTGANMQ